MTSTQGAYQFEFDDWSGGIETINPNTGLVTFINGSDNQAGVDLITNTTTFSQTSNPDPDPGEFFPSTTNFGPSGTNTTRSITFTLGVPS